MRTYCVTYEIVTPESSKRGDAEERGFCDGGDRDYQIPLPADIWGQRFTEWREKGGYTFDVPINPDDWPGFDPEDPEGEDESAACCRAMAAILLDAGATETSGYPHQPGDWYTSYRTGATTSYSYHLDGWTPEEESTIARLVKARNPRAAL